MIFSFERVEHIVERLAFGLALLGGFGLVFATVVTCLSILMRILRRILDSCFSTIFSAEIWADVRPILGEEELVQYGVGFALFSVLPLVMLRNGHIKIDLLKPVFSAGFNQFLNLLADVVLTTIAYLIMTRQWGLIFKKPRKNIDTIGELLINGDVGLIVERMRLTHESQILGLPLWPFYIAAEICAVAFFLAGVFCVIRSAKNLIKVPNLGKGV